MTARRARVLAVVPLVGAVAVIVTVAILSNPGDWLDELDVLAFGLTLLVLLLAPHVVLAVILLRAGPSRWLWRTAAVAAVITTAAQLVVSGIVITGDDPQTPILLALYAPVQVGAVIVFVIAGLLIGVFARRRSVNS